MTGITNTPDIYAEPPEERDPQDIYESCPHRLLCQSHYTRHGDLEDYEWEWLGCADCEWGSDADPCPYGTSGIARCGGPY